MGPGDQRVCGVFLVDGGMDEVGGKRWHVLQTKSRQEKLLRESLEARGMRVYLPLVEVQRNYGGRRAKVELPLFPGYLFLQGTLEEMYEADRTKRVARVI